VATLADIVATHETLHEESRQRFDRFAERFDRFVEQANQDRALMLQLIQAIAQGRNGN
jgi:DNA-binding SARP family transcriptional activator